MQHEGLNIAFLTHFAEPSSDDDSMRNHTEPSAPRYHDAQENCYLTNTIFSRQTAQHWKWIKTRRSFASSSGVVVFELKRFCRRLGKTTQMYTHWDSTPFSFFLLLFLFLFFFSRGRLESELRKDQTRSNAWPKLLSKMCFVVWAIDIFEHDEKNILVEWNCPDC